MAVNLPYEVWGTKGPVLLLLHGFTGNRTAWKHFEPSWSPSLRMVAVDLPGHGAAELPTRSGREGWGETLDALERVIDTVAGGQPVDVLGYSQGARLALALATRAPSRVRRLILESGTAGLKRRKERVARREQDEVLARTIEAGGVAAFLDRWEALPLFAGLRALPAPEQQRLRARREAATARGLAGALRCLGTGVQPSYWERLPLLRVPTLLLTGEKDAKFTDLARKMRQELPQAWTRVFEGAGHAPHLECPEAYAAEVLSFLRAPWTEQEQDAAHDAAASEPVRLHA